jgi:hypothetical protein
MAQSTAGGEGSKPAAKPKKKVEQFIYEVVIFNGETPFGKFRGVAPDAVRAQDKALAVSAVKRGAKEPIAAECVCLGSVDFA